MTAENTPDDFCNFCTSLNIMKTNNTREIKNLSNLKLRVKLTIIQKREFYLLTMTDKVDVSLHHA